MAIPTAGRWVSVSASLDAAQFYQGRVPPPQPLVFARPLAAGMFRIKMKFPEAAPAGVYLGVLELDGARRRFEAEVKAQPSLRASPSSLAFHGAAGEQIAASFTLLNAGNCGYDVPAAAAAGVFADGGLETALGKAYRAKDAGGQRWIDRLGDNLTEEHGGLVHIRVVEGSGPLQAGEMRLIRLHMRLPDQLRADKLYIGALEFGRLALPLEIDTSRNPPPEVLR